MLELFNLESIQVNLKKSLKSEHTQCWVQRVSNLRTSCISKVSGDLDPFTHPLKQLWARPWDEWIQKNLKWYFFPTGVHELEGKTTCTQITDVGCNVRHFYRTTNCTLGEERRKMASGCNPFQNSYVLSTGQGIRNCWAVSIWERVGFSKGRLSVMIGEAVAAQGREGELGWHYILWLFIHQPILFTSTYLFTCNLLSLTFPTTLSSSLQVWA